MVIWFCVINAWFSLCHALDGGDFVSLTTVQNVRNTEDEIKIKEYEKEPVTLRQELRSSDVVLYGIR